MVVPVPLDRHTEEKKTTKAGKLVPLGKIGEFGS